MTPFLIHTVFLFLDKYRHCIRLPLPYFALLLADASYILRQATGFCAKLVKIPNPLPEG